VCLVFVGCVDALGFVYSFCCFCSWIFSFFLHIGCGVGLEGLGLVLGCFVC
jgi:hypothetical protein